MMFKYVFNICVMLLSAVFTVHANTVIWSVHPIYDVIKPYTDELYLCQSQGKWGVINVTGDVLIPVEYDFITKADDDIGLYGVIKNHKYLLNGFVFFDGSSSSLSERFYVVPSYIKFYEGKLCVENSAGKQGFIDRNGSIVVKCQFDRVRPFCEGLSSVQKGPWVFYIREDYDSNPDLNVVYSAWRDGQVTRGSSFKNGEAVVGYNGKYRVINKEGRELRDFKASRWNVKSDDYTISDGNSVSEIAGLVVECASPIKLLKGNGKIGFQHGSKVILKPTFTDATPVDKNQISIVRYQGKYGLLKIIDDQLESSLIVNGNKASTIRLGYNNETEVFRYVLTVPHDYIKHSVLLVDKGNGIYNDETSHMVVNDNNISCCFKPIVGKKDKTKELRCKLIYKGIEVYETSQSLTVRRPIRIRLSDPVATEQADIETEIQKISSTIFNDSDEDVYVIATLSVDCQLNQSVSQRFQFTLHAHSSQTVTIPVKVKQDEDVKATIQLDTGVLKSSVVSLKIY